MVARTSVASLGASCLLFAAASAGCSAEVDGAGAGPDEGVAELDTPEGETAEAAQAACSPPTNYPWDEPVYREVKGATITARDQVCKPYVRGASGPGSFDCSGLVYHAYRSAGFPVTRLSAQGIFNTMKHRSGGAWGSLVGDWEKRAGDVLFYSPSCREDNITHVSIYMGRNRDNHKPEIVQALNPSAGVVLSGVDDTGLCRLDLVGRVKY